jgi:GTP cyclohydrolase I
MDLKKIEKAVKDILIAIGEDPKRAGILETPRRVAEMYQEILSGIGKDAGKEIKIQHADYDEIVLIKGIPLYSVCEHHMLPFVGKAHVAYIPKEGRVTGLSKLVRVVDVLSKRLQVQERLTVEIADILMKELKPLGVMVILEAEHFCMSMRGVQKPGTTTKTSAVKGVFRDNKTTRAETLSLIYGEK